MAALLARLRADRLGALGADGLDAVASVSIAWLCPPLLTAGAVSPADRNRDYPGRLTERRFAGLTIAAGRSP